MIKCTLGSHFPMNNCVVFQCKSLFFLHIPFENIWHKTNLLKTNGYCSIFQGFIFRQQVMQTIGVRCCTGKLTTTNIVPHRDITATQWACFDPFSNILSPGNPCLLKSAMESILYFKASKLTLVVCAAHTVLLRGHLRF